MRTRPLRAAPIAVPASRNIASTWPAATAVIAGAAPLKGTCSMRSPAARLSASMVRWETLAMPQDPKLSRPGATRTASRNASKSAASRRLGPTARAAGTFAYRLIGVKSATGS
jgi:hypothetical protein